jgi:anti-anti-sigma regulatory factor
MEIDHRVENGILIIAISGRLDAASASIAEGKINKALRGEQNRLLFDLSGLEYLSN